MNESKIIEFIDMCQQLKETAESYQKFGSQEKLDEIRDELDELEALKQDLNDEYGQ